MSATPPLKSLKNRRNKKMGFVAVVARNKHRNAQGVNYRKLPTIARNKHRNKPRCCCALRPFYLLREGRTATGATIVRLYAVRLDAFFAERRAELSSLRGAANLGRFVGRLAQAAPLARYDDRSPQGARP